MDLSLTFLGTSNAVPTAQRSHPAMWLDAEGDRILIDCGEGTQRQAKIAGLNPCKLTQIWLTHLHGDHVLGLPGLLETLEMSEYAQTLQIYGPRGTARHLNLLQQTYGQFKVQHTIHELPASNKTKTWHMETLPMNHGAPCHAFAFVVPEKLRLDKKKLAKYKLPNLPILGKLQQGHDITYNGKTIKAKSVTYHQPGKKIAFVMDTKINDNAITIAKGADVLVCEATYSNSEAEYADKYKHLTAAQAATIAKKAKVKQLILTHIAQRYEHNIKFVESEAKKIFKNTKAVKDFDVIKL